MDAIHCDLLCNANKIKIGGSYKLITAKFFNIQGNEITDEFIPYLAKSSWSCYIKNNRREEPDEVEVTDNTDLITWLEQKESNKIKIANKTTKKRAEEYNSAVKNKKKADSKKKTAQTKFNTANKNSSSLKTDAEAAIAGYQEGNELSYMDSLTDQNVTQTKQAADINNKAWEETKKNLNAQEKAKKQADDKVSKKAKAIKKKFGSKLSDNQKKKLAAGKEINVDKIKDKSLKKALTAYNKYVTTAAETEQKLNIVTDAESTAAANAAESQTEAAKATVEAIQSKFDNAKTYYEGLLGYQEKYNAMEEANIDLYNAHGNYERSSDYEIKISNTDSLRNIAQDKVDELEKRFQEGVDNGTIVEGSQEWINMKSEIVEAKKAVTDYDTNLIITIPNGKSVANYGYYTTVNGVKWYLVTYKDTPGFVSSRYLVK